MSTKRLHKTSPFLRRGESSPIKPARLLEYSVDTRRTYGYHIIVKHHERQTPISIEGMTIVILDNRLFLPLLELPVTRDVGVVLIYLAVPVLPVMELAGAQTNPGQESLCG